MVVAFLCTPVTTFGQNPLRTAETIDRVHCLSVNLVNSRLVGSAKQIAIKNLCSEVKEPITTFYAGSDFRSEVKNVVLGFNFRRREDIRNLDLTMIRSFIVPPLYGKHWGQAGYHPSFFHDCVGWSMRNDLVDNAGGLSPYTPTRYFNRNTCPFFTLHHFKSQDSGVGTLLSGFRSFGGFFGLLGNGQEGENYRPSTRTDWPPEETKDQGIVRVPTWAVPCGILYVFVGMLFIRFSGGSRFVRFCGLLCGIIGGVLILTGYTTGTHHNSPQMPRSYFIHN
jgi:hypothetical protein